jgi:hypothetical protein
LLNASGRCGTREFTHQILKMDLDNGRMERDGEELPECQQDGRTRHRPVAVAVVLSGQPFDVEL